ncbi:MAG: TetR/AcrR family transcriptional regulator [Bacteroidota bacterium]
MTDPNLTAKRREEEKEQRRQSILDAAERGIALKGFDGLTMGDVAKEARLSRGLVYFYFQDKVDLFNGLAHRAIAELVDRFEEAVARHDAGHAQIKAIGQAYIQFAHSRPVPFAALARFETRQLNPKEVDHHAAAALQETKATLQVMMRAIQTGQADGSVRESLDPLMTAVSLWGFIHGMIQVAAMKGAMFEQNFGFDTSALMEHAFEMAGLALSPS